MHKAWFFKCDPWLPIKLVSDQEVVQELLTAVLSAKNDENSTNIVRIRIITSVLYHSLFYKIFQNHPKFRIINSLHK